MDKPLLSISCITYNHEKYIKDCLEGFLKQNTDFETEILIHDDASTDNTQSIIKKYQNDYPEIIKPILQTENQYSIGQRGISIKFNVPRAQGKYIALCEGDDYWTDPLKLQKQVDFLEAHPECAFCFTRAEQEFTGTDKKNIIYPKTISSSVLSATDYLDIPTTATCSLVFRNYPKTHGTEFTMLPHSHGDFLLYCNLLQLGKAGAIEDVTCVYRKQAGGVSFAYNSIKYLYRRANELKIEKETFQNSQIQNAIHQKYKSIVHQLLIKYPRSEEAKAISREINKDVQFWKDRAYAYLRMIKNKLNTYV